MPAHTTHVHNLLRVLQQELLLGQHLMAISESETEAIIANDITRLSVLELDLRRHLEEQERLELARTGILRDLAFALRLEGLPTLTGLLTHLPPRERMLLSQLRVQILETQNELDKLTTRNKMLLENALEYVRFSLHALTEAALSPARYGTNLAAINTSTYYIDSKA